MKAVTPLWLDWNESRV